MKWIPGFLVSCLFFFAPCVPWAQCVPTSAKICVSGDDTTQMWVNGSYLGSKDYCNLAAGCKADNLCFEIPMFLISGPQVCLAIKTENKNPVDVFSSWELEVDCAGGKPFVVNSENPAKSGVSLYWDPTGGSTCGPGAPPPADSNGNAWTSPDYNPASNPFTLTGTLVTSNTWTCAQIKSVQTNAVIPFISYDVGAEGSGPTKGCGNLYWRQIAKLPAWLPTATPTVVSTPTWTFTATSTFTPRLVPTATFTRTPQPIPTSTATSTPRPRLIPTPIPTPRLRLVPTPQVRRYKLKPTATFVYHRPTATPTFPPYPTSTPTPRPIRQKPTPLPTFPPRLDKTQKIVFQTPPVQVYLTFADGPGRYQLEITDSTGNLMQVVLDRKVVAESDTWAMWDGKDGQGRDVPPGQYFAVFYRNGKPLRSISVFRSGNRAAVRDEF